MNATKRSVLSACLLALSVSASCWDGAGLAPTLLPDIRIFRPEGDTLLVRLAQITDTHIVDAASPGRLTEFESIITEAWRPHEQYATHVLDGMIRSINRYHREVGTIDALIHTGDAVDNAQLNELRWFLDVMDGERVNPLSVPDDRDPANLPPPDLDPYQPFQAEGVYTHDRHGPLPTIPWYGLVGNHDVYAAGNFPVVETLSGRRVAPLPLSVRLGIVLPDVLIPDGGLTYAPLSPANPGPPSLLNIPVGVQAVPDRAFVTRREIVEAYYASVSEPRGHGFPDPNGSATWYSTLLAENLRLIALDTADVPLPIRGVPYFAGAISTAQRAWFEGQLAEASQQGQWVVVASHHPSSALLGLYGSSILPDGFRRLLNTYDNVILHLAGHEHVNRVFDWGGYVEIVTASTLDYPQTGRIIEIHDADDAIEIAYHPISHMESADPLSGLRAIAVSLAAKDAGRTAKRIAPSTLSDAESSDRLVSSRDPESGMIRLSKPHAASASTRP